MGIVGTVDSAYKAMGAAVLAMDGAAMLVTEQIALDSGAPSVFDTRVAGAGAR
jgi:hypothetical protein